MLDRIQFSLYVFFHFDGGENAKEKKTKFRPSSRKIHSPQTKYGIESIYPAALLRQPNKQSGPIPNIHAKCLDPVFI